MASAAPAISISTDVVEETPEEVEERQGRISSRLQLDKFGTAAQYNVTIQCPTAIAIEWVGEESQQSPKTGSGGKYKAKNVSSKKKTVWRPKNESQYMYREDAFEIEERNKSPAVKCQDLIKYCESLIPRETTGGKKKKKKKKQKLSHAMETVSKFLEVGVTPPKNTKELPTTIEKLQALVD